MQTNWFIFLLFFSSEVCVFVRPAKTFVIKMCFISFNDTPVGYVTCSFFLRIKMQMSIYRQTPSSPRLDNIRVMVIVRRLRGNIIRTALCWIVWHNVHSQQHTYMSSSYRSNRLGLSHWDPYTVRRGGCLELYNCNMVEWFWWDSSLISTTNWFPTVLWHCLFGHPACKNRPQYDLQCVEWYNNQPTNPLTLSTFDLSKFPSPPCERPLWRWYQWQWWQSDNYIQWPLFSVRIVTVHASF